MGQTILDEYLATWQSTGTQPDPTQFGFDGLYAMLEECQDVMLGLGTAANDGRRTIEVFHRELTANRKRIAELATQRDQAFQAIEATRAEYESQARQMFSIIEDRRIAELEQLNQSLEQSLGHSREDYVRAAVDYEKRIAGLNAKIQTYTELEEQHLLHIDAQGEQIAELKAQLAAAQTDNATLANLALDASNIFSYTEQWETR